MPRRIITEEELREAAREVLEYELAIFDSYNDYPDHIFHGKFRLNMAALIHEVKRGAVEAAKYSMGFTFYAKQCIAAVLILFTLSCIAMPETVLAGYHKLIEVIETVFEDYTEYRYRVNDDGGIEETFKPLKLGYLPEGMEEVNRREYADSIDILYMGSEELYLNIHQKKFEKKDGTVFVIDNEATTSKKIQIEKANLILIYKREEICYSFSSDKYTVFGITNLNETELLKIIKELKS